MNALLKLSPISSCHFRWCPHRDEIKSCNRCHAQFYIFAIALTGIVAAIQLWGYGKTRSESLLADTFHVLSDNLGYCVGLGLMLTLLYGLWVQEQEVISQNARSTVALLTVGAAVYMLFQSGSSLLSVISYGVLPGLMGEALLWRVSGIGLVANLILLVIMWFLRIEIHSHEESHSSGHNHEEDILAFNFVHTAGDSFSSVGVLVTGVLWDLTGDPRVTYLDHSVAIGISLWMLYGVRKILLHP